MDHGLLHARIIFSNIAVTCTWNQSLREEEAEIWPQRECRMQRINQASFLVHLSIASCSFLFLNYLFFFGSINLVPLYSHLLKEYSARIYGHMALSPRSCALRGWTLRPGNYSFLGIAVGIFTEHGFNSPTSMRNMRLLHTRVIFAT